MVEKLCWGYRCVFNTIGYTLSSRNRQSGDKRRVRGVKNNQANRRNGGSWICHDGGGGRDGTSGEMVASAHDGPTKNKFY
jgi:hypothetical protein